MRTIAGWATLIAEVILAMRCDSVDAREALGSNLLGSLTQCDDLFKRY